MWSAYEQQTQQITEHLYSRSEGLNQLFSLENQSQPH
jgi:hypothetical protein